MLNCTTQRARRCQSQRETQAPVSVRPLHVKPAELQTTIHLPALLERSEASRTVTRRRESGARAQSWVAAGEITGCVAELVAMISACMQFRPSTCAPAAVAEWPRNTLSSKRAVACRRCLFYRHCGSANQISALSSPKTSATRFTPELTIPPPCHCPARCTCLASYDDAVHCCQGALRCCTTNLQPQPAFGRCGRTSAAGAAPPGHRRQQHAPRQAVSSGWQCAAAPARSSARRAPCRCRGAWWPCRAAPGCSAGQERSAQRQAEAGGSGAG